MNPRLSIVTPTLNCASTMMATLASLRPLVAEGIAEHIVVDSGSTDGTVELCRQTGASVLTHPKGNLYAAINAGMRAARGEWLTYINGDDVLYADGVAQLLEAAREPAIVYGNFETIDGAGRLLYSWRTAPPWAVGRLLRFVSSLHQHGTLVHRDVYQQLHGFDETLRLSSDYDFFLRASCAGVRFLKPAAKPVAGFRVHGTQLSQQHSNIAEMAREGRLARERCGIRHSRAGKLGAVLAMKLFNVDTIFSRPLRSMFVGTTQLGFAVKTTKKDAP